MIIFIEIKLSDYLLLLIYMEKITQKKIVDNLYTYIIILEYIYRWNQSRCLFVLYQKTMSSVKWYLFFIDLTHIIKNKLNQKIAYSIF